MLRTDSALYRLVLCVVIATFLAAPGLGDEGTLQLQSIPRIVNGIPTHQFPTTVEVGTRSGAGIASSCTGTLIGCQTVLSAAHCFCEGTGASCNPNPSNVVVFGQHFGFVDVTNISVPSNYEFAVASDVAVLTLASPVSGIPPTPINTTRKPESGLTGKIVGFGLSHGSLDDTGIKREGEVEIANCTTVPNGTHVCWNFQNPMGAPGDDSNTCPGDSGGPLFVDFGAGDVVAGVTSGGDSASCLPPDASYDADVYGNRAFIQAQGGSDIEQKSCGSLPQIGSSGATIVSSSGTLGPSNGDDTFMFDVPEGTQELRVTLNGEDGQSNDFDLSVKRGGIPTGQDNDCQGIRDGTYESCTITSPASGTWYLKADHYLGEGDYQVTVTLFGESGGSTGPCVPSSETACLAGGRFKTEVDWKKSDGSTGTGEVGGLGLDNGEVFYFFNANNPEMLVKVLNGCPVNSRFWVFMAATTDVEFTLTVTDTETGQTSTYFNPQGTAAAPVQDTSAFATCP